MKGTHIVTSAMGVQSRYIDRQSLSIQEWIFRRSVNKQRIFSEVINMYSFNEGAFKSVMYFNMVKNNKKCYKIVKKVLFSPYARETHVRIS